jgi:hypothetical protein
VRDDATMTDRPVAPSRPCAARGCTGSGTDPAHVVNVAPAATLPYRVPLCPEHWREVEQGAEWFAEERPGERGERGVDVVIGKDLVDRRIAVAEEDGVVWRRGGFSARLDPERNFGLLAVEGRLYGSDERARLDLALTPDVVRTLRSIVRLYDG